MKNGTESSQKTIVYSYINGETFTIFKNPQVKTNIWLKGHFFFTKKLGRDNKNDFIAEI